ncbi:DUF2304 domain-containing protein [Patulibacter minatonensis]|uniref:DUF2304 domain-containing protein n=1 Tax=Patulibacter minatonensis TaxID=298163 RepID=UPI0004AF979F|nr:DUF2304 domain-containing protein [Patulibacter minatonensis]
MTPRLQIVAILVTLALFFIVFELVRRRRLMERYALLWLFSTVVLLGLSIWSDALSRLSDAIGVRYGPSALFAVAFGFVLMLLLHFSLVLSRLSDQSKVLAQEVGRLREKVDRLESDRQRLLAEADERDAEHETADAH